MPITPKLSHVRSEAGSGHAHATSLCFPVCTCPRPDGLSLPPLAIPCGIFAHLLSQHILLLAHVVCILFFLCHISFFLSQLLLKALHAELLPQGSQLSTCLQRNVKEPKQEAGPAVRPALDPVRLNTRPQQPWQGLVHHSKNTKTKKLRKQSAKGLLYPLSPRNGGRDVGWKNGQKPSSAEKLSDLLVLKYAFFLQKTNILQGSRTEDTWQKNSSGNVSRHVKSVHWELHVHEHLPGCMKNITPF